MNEHETDTKNVATSAANPADTQPYTVADYLVQRLAEVGVTEVFGVPGDFNLAFLDHIVDHPDMRWVGNANELNAGYAADGYARLRGVAALVTTYGVGELSAINATAGSFAEYAPVIHIVGAPSKDAQAAGAIVHHTLGDGDFSHFRRMASEVTCAQADLSPADAVDEIDRVIRQVITHRRPGYIQLSTDVARVQVDPPAQPLNPARDFTSPQAKADFRTAVEKFLSGHKVTVLADLLVHRLGANEQLQRLIDHDLPHATLMWGKTLLDESNPYALGVYAGAASDPSVREAVEEGDRLIMAGVKFNDTVTAGFTHNIDSARAVTVNPDHAMVGDKAFAPLRMQDALEVLADVADTFTHVDPPADTDNQPYQWQAGADEPLTQADLWQVLSGALSEGNIVVAEQGTSFFGLSGIKFPGGTTFIGQPQWGSIGYTLPAAMGAGLACPGRRPVLVIGDGSAQLTIQELGTWLRENLNGVIVVINNDGYTIERAIHGEDQHYNDISTWRWRDVPHALGAQPDQVLTLHATTRDEFAKVCEQTTQEPNKLVFIEVEVGRTDYPETLRKLGEAINKRNSQ